MQHVNQGSWAERLEADGLGGFASVAVSDQSPPRPAARGDNPAHRMRVQSSDQDIRGSTLNDRRRDDVLDQKRARSAESNRDRPCTAFARMRVAIATGFFVALFGAFSPPLAHARDLVIFAEPTLKPALRAVGQLWRARTGVRVDIFGSRSELALEQAGHNIRCDLVIVVAGEVMDDAKADEVIKSGTVTPVFRNSLVLVSRDPNAGLLAGAGGDLATLVAGKKLAIADPERDPAGSHGIKALGAAGLNIDANSAKIAVAESSAGVLSMLSDNKVQLGIVYLTDALTRPALKILMPLAESTYPAINYVAAATASADEKSDTRGFLAFVKSDEATAVLRSAGLQPIRD
jgi:molybdate transport system substrate-binding protein